MKDRYRRALALGAVLASLFAAVPASSAQVSSTSAFVRGVFGRDKSSTRLDTIQNTGFNAVTVTPLDTADLGLISRKGMKAIVWLWDYNNDTCQFQRNNDWIRYHVGRLAENPAVQAYHIADEPSANRCPTASAQLRARTDLIHSIDPGTPTFVALTIRGGQEWYPYQHFVDSADILGLVVYPCTWKHGCRFGMIASAIKEAKADGVERFWAIMQDFGKSTNWYKQPTPTQLAQQFDAWATSGMEGYMVYHWGYGQLDSKPGHLSVLSQQNARDFIADVTAPTAPGNVNVVWNAPNVRVTWDPSTDNVGVTGYRIYLDGKLVDNVDADTHEWTNKYPVWNPHTYYVTAGDAAGNFSEPSVSVFSGG